MALAIFAQEKGILWWVDERAVSYTHLIETLARVDTLCLDKTGTITEGTMQVDGIEPLCPIPQPQVEDAIAAVTHALNDENPTSMAMKQLGLVVPDWICVDSVDVYKRQG